MRSVFAGELFCVDLVVFCGLCSWFDCSVLGWFLGAVYCVCLYVILVGCCDCW